MISQLNFIVLRPHAGPLNAEMHGLACHTLVSMCLFGKKFIGPCKTRKTKATNRYNRHLNLSPQVEKDKYNPYLSSVLTITNSTSLLAVKIIFQQTI